MLVTNFSDANLTVEALDFIARYIGATMLNPPTCDALLELCDDCQFRETNCCISANLDSLSISQFRAK